LPDLHTAYIKERLFSRFRTSELTCYGNRCKALQAWKSLSKLRVTFYLQTGYLTAPLSDRRYLTLNGFLIAASI